MPSLSERLTVRAKAEAAREAEAPAPPPAAPLIAPPTSAPPLVAPLVSAPPPDAPPQKSAPLQKAPRAHHSSGAPQSAPPPSGPAILVRLPEEPRDRVRGKYSKIPNVIFDSELLIPLNAVARYIYLDFVRLSLGHNRGWVKISREGLAERTGFSENGCVKALRELAAAGLVVSEGTDYKSTERGTVYWVYVPTEALSEIGPAQSGGALSGGAPAGPPPSAAMKETSKERHERAVAPAPTLSVYEVRERAARILEANRSTRGYSLAELRADVRTALIAEKGEADAPLIEEATRNMLPAA